MLEAIILGSIQGIAEWLPISSEAMIFLVKSNFFNQGESILDIARLALFLHLGTFLAAFVYFRKDIIKLTCSLIDYKNADSEDKKIINFLVVATLVSGSLGSLFLFWFSEKEDFIAGSAIYLNLIIGLLLIVTGILQLRVKTTGSRQADDLNKKDNLALGVAQGFAALPGLSRSGLTVSFLLLRKVNKELALKLSFLMSLPIVLAGNIVLNFNELSYSLNNLVALLTSFVFGLITIGALLGLARKINFGYFVLSFGILMAVFSFF